MVCTLCGERRARRACPALNQRICPVCCGTKRLVQISCPTDCAYLATSREHPPAAEVRRHQRDLDRLASHLRDLTERQSQLFFLVGSFLMGYQPPELQVLLDDDVAEATAAMAATLETAARGVIYEHRPASLPAERLTAALKAALEEAGKGAGSSFDRDAAVALRRIEEAARGTRSDHAEGGRTLLELFGRVLRRPDAPSEAAALPESRIIVP